MKFSGKTGMRVAGFPVKLEFGAGLSDLVEYPNLPVMRRYSWLLAFMAFCCSCASAQSSQKPFEVIAYYTGDGEAINKYPVDKLTHIIYSFLHLKGDTIAFDEEAHKTTLRQLVALKQKYPNLKVMFSLGGWGGCETCSGEFSTKEGRQHFASSVLKVCQDYGADGIDLDWEYPAIEGFPGHQWLPEDRDNFTALLKELHNLLAPTYELSFAAGGFTKFLAQSIDWAAVFPLVNRVNLMTYDLVHGYSTETGHQTALYSQAAQTESTDHCVQWLLDKGYPANKLVIGAAFYAREWENVGATGNGRYQQGHFKKAFDYQRFDAELAADSGWVKYWDDTSRAPYAYNAGKRLFATYDDERSLTEKVNYAQKHRLGGIMFWELQNDKFSNGLLDAIDSAKQ